MSNLNSYSNFNKHNLIIPEIKIDITFLHYLLGLNTGIVNVVDYYTTTLSTSKLNRYSNFETISDLENPLEGQTDREFKKMLKYLKQCEDVFIDALKNNGFSNEEAINQWIIYANIINLDEGLRFLRITLRYNKQNNNYLDKLVKANPGFSEKIYNLNKFGFDVKSKEELATILTISKRAAESSGCMSIFIITLLISFLI